MADINPIIHTMISFNLPHGSQIIVWTNHCELRFLKKDGQTVLQWWRDMLSRMEREMAGLCEDKVVERCPDCTAGRKNNTICPSCSGSGIKGFVPPGKEKVLEKAPETIRVTHPSAISPEVIAEAQRILDSRKALSPSKPVVQQQIIQPIVSLSDAVKNVPPQTNTSESKIDS